MFVYAIMTDSPQCLQLDVVCVIRVASKSGNFGLPLARHRQKASLDDLISVNMEKTNWQPLSWTESSCSFGGHSDNIFRFNLHKPPVRTVEN